MIEILEYAMPANVAEAYALLASRKDATVIGGGTFIRLTAKKIGLAVDLSRAGLDYIRETDSAFEIGAMTTLRSLETHEGLNLNFSRIFANATGRIVGVQFRNLATVGGTVFGRYAFSDLITALLVLECNVVLHQAGEMPLAAFLASPRTGHEILEKISIRKTSSKAAYQAFRGTAGSLPFLTAAVSSSAAGFRIALGARPGQPVLAADAMAYLQSQAGGQDNPAIDKNAIAVQAALRAAAETPFGDDRRASGAYRRLLAQALVERAILEVLG
jgi:CO/xanthine dehydrogenase FAD-binding subunit